MLCVPRRIPHSSAMISFQMTAMISFHMTAMISHIAIPSIHMKMTAIWVRAVEAVVTPSVGKNKHAGYEQRFVFWEYFTEKRMNPF